MEKRVIITSIQIKTANKTKVLDKNEIKKFCRERVQISVKEIISDAHLNGGSTKNEQQQLKVKDISKVNRTDLIYVFQSLKFRHKFSVIHFILD